VNLGQYISDAIRIANRLQKVGADNRTQEIYQLALELREVSKEIQSLIANEYLKETK
jgi:hypothetical protein